MPRFSLVIAAVVALLGTVCAVTWGLKWVSERRHLQEYATARDVIYEQVRGILASQGVLKMAARLGTSAGNAELARCVLKTEPCRVTSPNQQVSFSIPEGRDSVTTLFAGAADHPASYSRKGAVGCQAGDEECPGWLVTAWFWADCPNQEPTCVEPSSLHVRLQVAGVGILAALDTNPPKDLFEADKTSFSDTVKLSAGGVP